MSEAKKCDRCGLLFETQLESANYGSLYDKTPNAKGELDIKCYDLCSECMKVLVKWIREGNSVRCVREE